MTQYQEIKGSVSFFGCLFRFLLIGWQVLMLICIPLFGPIALLVWVAGTLLLGMFVLLTPRTRMMVPITDDD